MMDTNFPKAKLYLSRRNLLALLSKLDRDAAGDDTACSLIKYQQKSPAYQQTMDSIMVIAVQDEDYYLAQERAAGDIHPLDEENIAKAGACTGCGSCSCGK